MRVHRPSLVGLCRGQFQDHLFVEYRKSHGLCRSCMWTGIRGTSQHLPCGPQTGTDIPAHGPWQPLASCSCAALFAVICPSPQKKEHVAAWAAFPAGKRNGRGNASLGGFRPCIFPDRTRGGRSDSSRGGTCESQNVRQTGQSVDLAMRWGIVFVACLAGPIQPHRSQTCRLRPRDVGLQAVSYMPHVCGRQTHLLQGRIKCRRIRFRRI